MRRVSLLLALTIALLAVLPAREAQAIDPVTIAILAPIALKAAETARPYIMKGLASGAKHMLTMGMNILEIFLLPLGVLQATIGAPFGFFSNGMMNVFEGGIAPFKLAWNCLMMPLAFFGLY